MDSSNEESSRSVVVHSVVWLGRGSQKVGRCEGFNVCVTVGIHLVGYIS